MSTVRTPSYCRQKRKGRHDTAFAVIDGHRHQLGRFNSPESRQRYDRLIAEWLAGGRRITPAPEQITISEVLAAYLRHAEAYYRDAQGNPTTSLDNVKQAMRPLRLLYGPTAVTDFGPRRLKAVRQRMIDKGWCRTHINKQVRAIKRMFDWAASEEIIPAAVAQGVQTVAGLPKGRSDAPETDPIKPVPAIYIDAVLSHVSDEVTAMVELQRLTGMRPGEVVLMRTGDIDMAASAWTYKPHHHKTAYRDRERRVLIGPRAQAILRPWLKADLQAYLFDPSEAERRRKAKGLPDMKGRKRANPRRMNQKPNVKRTNRKLGDRYTAASYRRAIHRSCRKADIPQWSPNQLRHNYATMIRKEHGLEAAQIMLGHAKADVTQVYAERDMAKAMEVALKVG